MSLTIVSNRVCSVEGCEKPHLARGYCNRHYQRNKKYGTPCPQMVCDRCHELSEITATGKAVQKYCASCRPIVQREQSREWLIAHPEWNRAKVKAWREADRERWLRSSRECYYRNWERNREMRKINREVLAERGRAWAQAHPEMVAARARRRYARKRGAEGTHTLAEFRALCSAYDWKCTYCARAVDVSSVTEDHIVPIVRGGDDGIANIVPACRSCNSSKGTATLPEYVNRLLLMVA